MPKMSVNNISLPLAVSQGGTGSGTAADAALSLNLEVGTIDMDVTGKTLTITCSTPCTRFIPNSTSGVNTLIDISGKEWSFNFDSSYNAAGCGITETVDWASPMPWFVYLINGTNAAAGIQAAVTRNPCMKVLPAEGYIHYSDAAADTDAQTSVIVPYADGTDYSAKPVLLIGSYRMTYATSDDDWTPSALASTDGYGKFQEGVQFTFPVGQMGNTAVGHYNEADGATALTFTTYEAAYWIGVDGKIDYTLNCNDYLVTGAAVDLRFYLPYTASATTVITYGASRQTTGGVPRSGASAGVSTGLTYMLLINATDGILEGSDFAVAGDGIKVTLRYSAY